MRRPAATRTWCRDRRGTTTRALAAMSFSDDGDDASAVINGHSLAAIAERLAHCKEAFGGAAGQARSGPCRRTWPGRRRQFSDEAGSTRRGDVEFHAALRSWPQPTGGSAPCGDSQFGSAEDLRGFDSSPSTCLPRNAVTTVPDLGVLAAQHPVALGREVEEFVRAGPVVRGGQCGVGEQLVPQPQATPIGTR